MSSRSNRGGVLVSKDREDMDDSSSIESFSRPSSPYYAYRYRQAAGSSSATATAIAASDDDDDDDDIITDDMEETEAASTKRASSSSSSSSSTKQQQKKKNSLSVSEINQAASDRLLSLVRYRKVFEPFIPPKVMQLLNELLLLKNSNNNTTSSNTTSNNNTQGGGGGGQQQTDFDDDIILSQPPSLSAGCVMKGYQLEGLSWLVRNYNRAINCILADEMGLGKTLQSISLVAHLALTKHLSGPYLFVVPLSVLFNWMAEFKKWCPALKVVRLHSNDKDEQMRLKNMLRDPDIAQV
jgi:SNF2 family DNA or RNA helicase